MADDAPVTPVLSRRGSRDLAVTPLGCPLEVSPPRGPGRRSDMATLLLCFVGDFSGERLRAEFIEEKERAKGRIRSLTALWRPLDPPWPPRLCRFGENPRPTTVFEREARVGLLPSETGPKSSRGTGRAPRTPDSWMEGSPSSTSTCSRGVQMPDDSEFAEREPAR